jgi:hypothetical protein
MTPNNKILPTLFFLLLLFSVPATILARPIKYQPQNQFSFLPNENEVKSFVYSWFSWIDYLSDEKIFTMHLCEANLFIKYNNDKTITNNNEFTQWYKSFKDKTQSSNTLVSNIEVTKIKDRAAYNVTMDVLYRIKPKDGKFTESAVLQKWILVVDKSGGLSIEKCIETQKDKPTSN